jgi:hypothetical protein
VNFTFLTTITVLFGKSASALEVAKSTVLLYKFPNNIARG